MTHGPAQCPACFRLVEPDVFACPRCGSGIAGAGVLHVSACGPASAGPVNDGPRLDPSGDWAVGSVIHQRYKIVGFLGAGGMGTVYKAQDLFESREIALKVLDADLMLHRTAGLRMQQEAEALRKIHHPNVVHLYHAFDCQGRLVLALELVAGGTLTQLIGDRGCSEPEALYLLQGILAGLQAIHTAGLVHRDLKPDNVLLNAAGVPKLADLGVARDLTSGPGRIKTHIGTRIGTPYYMSPEQAQALDVDVRSDIFSVGVLAYELLCGNKAFEAASELEVLAAIVRQQPPLNRLAGRCSPNVIDVLAQAMSKDREQRFASAAAMARALELG